MPDTTVHATPLLLIFFYNRFFMPLFFDAFEVNHSLHFGYSTCAVLPSGQNNAAKHGTANYYHHRQGEKEQFASHYTFAILRARDTKHPTCRYHGQFHSSAAIPRDQPQLGATKKINTLKPLARQDQGWSTGEMEG